MAVDKLVDSTQLDSDLTSVANAIRAKSGGSSQLAFPAGFVSEIQAIPSGGGELQYSQSVIIPSQEYGRSANGGCPKAFEYFYSILPQSWVLARLVLLDDPQTVQNYSAYEITSGRTYDGVPPNDKSSLKRVVNGAIVTVHPTNGAAGWSFIISPDYEYLLEVWS